MVLSAEWYQNLTETLVGVKRLGLQLHQHGAIRQGNGDGVVEKRKVYVVNSSNSNTSRQVVQVTARKHGST